MFSRRRRSRGGYMIKVPMTPPALDISNQLTNKVYFIHKFALTNIQQYTLELPANQLANAITGTTQSYSPEYYILQDLYQDTDKRSDYFVNSVIQYISVTGRYINSVCSKVIIKAQSIDISMLQNENYLIDKKMTVDVDQAQSYCTYMFPLNISKQSVNVISLKIASKVETYNGEEKINEEIFTGDLSYNHSVIDGEFYIEIQTNNSLEEAFDKYYIGKYTEVNQFTKFKPITVVSGEILTDSLQLVTW